MQVLKKEYSSHAQQQFSFTFCFESDFVSLAIPKEGLQLDGWKVTPFYNPQVSLPYGGYLLLCSLQDSTSTSLSQQISVILSLLAADHKEAGEQLQFWQKHPQM